MKKFAFILSIFSAVLFSTSTSFAEDYAPQSDDQQMDMQQPDNMQGGGRREMTQDRGGKKMGMMKGGMMGMHQQSVVATSDGGVVILSGGKLAKYDANLNLVNEVELKKDKGPNVKNAQEERPVRRAPREQTDAVESVPTPQFAEEVLPEAEYGTAEAPPDEGEWAPS